MLGLYGCGMYVPKAKSYVIIQPNGQTTIKGIIRKRNRYLGGKTFPVDFMKLYFLESEEKAMAFYRDLRESILQGRIPIEELTITSKIGSAEKQLLKFGKSGEVASNNYTEQKRIHSRTTQRLPSIVEREGFEPSTCCPRRRFRDRCKFNNSY
ncbi:MAG: hypothetical protein HC924_16910 [Synechococcaceae cyanobacterium SM2_3_2]|nr:hypothetical protein [Synechococcaceae cyanobacterium SM2_3_2]